VDVVAVAAGLGTAGSCRRTVGARSRAPSARRDATSVTEVSAAVTGTPVAVNAATRRTLLGARHRLTPSRRTDDPVAITEDLVALHSSDPASVYLSVAARMVNPSFAPLDTALYDERRLIRHHAMRRTLFVFTPATARIAHAACTTTLVARQRRTTIALLEDSGVTNDGAAWLDDARRQILDALASLAPGPGGIAEATARTLGRLVPSLLGKVDLAPDKSYGGSVAAHTRVLLLLGFEGEIVRGRPTGSWINSEYHWALTRSVVPGGLIGLDADVAAVELARRYLASFGPASTADLQWWTGWTAATTKRALAGTGAVPAAIEGESGWILPDDDALSGGAREPEPWIALLPGLDSTTMGWKRRDWYLPLEHTRGCSTATATRARRSGSTAGSSAAGSSAATVRSRSASSRMSVASASTRSKRRQTASSRSSATRASPSASRLRCRRS
jgi:hypothetical protein